MAAPTSPAKPLYQDHSEVFPESEIFDAVGLNDVKRVRELLDSGVDINIQVRIFHSLITYFITYYMRSPFNNRNHTL